MVTGGYKGIQTCVCRRTVYNKEAILSYPIQGVTRGNEGYRRLQRGCKGLQRVTNETGGYRRLQRGCKGLQRVTNETGG